MSNNALHSVSVAAIVIDDAERVLVIQQRDNGKWEPPGGVLELGESILEGLQREVQEETGLLIEPQRLTGVYKNIARGIVALVFRARARGGTLRASDETVQAQWWPRDVIAEHLDEAYAVRVLDAFEAHGPAVRVHDGIRVINS